MKAKEPFVSIIVPVKNEAKLLESFLKSVKQLSYPKEKIEVIVADGRSADNTKGVALKYRAKVVDNPKQTVGPGRNVAFEKAKGGLIAFSDADCLVDKNWLINSLKYFSDPKAAGVGGPNFTPEDESNFGKAVGFFMSQAIFSAGSIHGRNLPYIKEVKSIPGCNSIYQKRVLDKVMPIDESLLTCDDTEMNQRILDLGYKLLSVPDVFVWHYRKSTPKRLWQQMYRWAIGRLQVGKKRRDMINLVHISAGFSLPILIGILAFLFLIKPAPFSIFIGTVILALAFLVLFGFLKTKSLGVCFNLPLVVIITIFAWSFGFLRELFIPLKTPAGQKFRVSDFAVTQKLKLLINSKSRKEVRTKYGREFLDYLVDATNLSHFNLFEDFIQMLVKNISFYGKMLDFGCGYGIHALLLNPYCKKITGIDIDPSKIAVFRKLVKETGTKNVKPQVADGQNLPFTPNTFDIVYCHESLSHVKNINRALSETYRVLKRKGEIIVVDTKRWHPYGIWMIYIRGDKEENYFNIWIMKQLLKKAGFANIQRVKNITAPRNPLRRWNRQFWWLNKFLDPKYVLTGEKRP